jgi:hypothetical protein
MLPAILIRFAKIATPANQTPFGAIANINIVQARKVRFH